MKVTLALPDSDPRPFVELLGVGIITRTPADFDVDESVYSSLVARGFVVQNDAKEKSVNKSKKSVAV